MVKKAETSEATRKTIVDMKEAGMRGATIARILKIPARTVSSILARFRERNTVSNAPRTGRPRSTSARQDKRIVRLSKADPTLTSVDIAAEINASDGTNISRRTVARRLNAAGLIGRRPAKKPLISPKNRKARVEFARRHQHWTSNEWSKVLFTDESKFNLFGSDGIKYVRRPSGERYNPRYTKPTVKHGGGSVMVYGAFSFHGMGPILRIEGTMTGQSYANMIIEKILPWAEDNMPAGWVLQQNNDPKHTSRAAKDAFQQKDVRLLDWPSQSPDPNPIEHIWEELERRCTKQRCSNKDQKFALLAKEWSAMPTTVFQRLIGSMPARCAAVIKSRGFPTKY
ncbi:hypothetical protein V3C99_015479, partial [Haemonchus contortus]